MATQPFEQLGSNPIYVTFSVTIPASGVIGGPDYPVPHGATVRVRGLPGNAAVVTVGIGSDYAALNGPNEQVVANTEILCPVANLRDVYLAGAAGKGAIITVKR